MSVTAEYPLVQPILLPYRRHLMVGFGEWGLRVMAATAHSLHFSHPELVGANEWLHLGKAGCGWFGWRPQAPLGAQPHLAFLGGGRDNPNTAQASKQGELPQWLTDSSRQGTLALFTEVIAAATGQSKLYEAQEYLRRFGDAWGLDRAERDGAHPFDQLGYRPVVGEAQEKILDIYLIGRFDDPFVQTALPSTLTLINQALIQGYKFSFSLFLGVDSTAFPYMSQDARESLRDAVEKLSTLLTPASNQDEAQGKANTNQPSTTPQAKPGKVQPAAQGNAKKVENLDWCYIVDTVDDGGQTIARSSGKNLPDDNRSSLLAEAVGHYIALLIGSEMREESSYRRLASPGIARLLELPPDRAFCSSFSCASYVLPVDDLIRHTAVRLGMGMLQQVTQANRTDGDLVNKLVEEGLVTFKLEHDTLEASLLRVADAQPVGQMLDPASLEGVPDEQLVDSILSWDVFFVKEELQRVLDAIDKEAHARLQGAQEWAGRRVDETISHSPSGIAEAQEFSDRFMQQMKQEEQPSRKPKPRERPGLFRSLFAPPAPDNLDPETYADPTPAQRDLQYALGNRVQIPAVWLRYIFMAVFEIAFVLAGWGYIRSALDISLGSNLGLPAGLLDPWAFPIFILGANILAAWNHIIRSENRVSNSRDRLIKALQRKHRAIIRLHIAQRMSDVYTGITAFMKCESKALETFRGEVSAVSEKLKSEAASVQEYQPLCFERVVPLPAEGRGKDAASASIYAESGVRDLTVEWLQSGDLNGWRDLSAPGLHTSIYGFARYQVKQRLDLSIEGYVAGRGEEQLAQLLDELQRQTKIQLPIANFPKAAPLHFLGVADRRESRIRELPLQHDSTLIITTRDVARIVFAPTVHALALRELAIWKELL